MTDRAISFIESTGDAGDHCIGLRRLIDTNRGGVDLQNWTLDSLGNWSGFIDQGTSQTRTANAANEITGVTSNPDWIDPQYDAAGNMTTMPKPGDPTAGFTATYDAWNRMVGLSDSGGTVASYEYDGTNRRITKTVGATTEDHYYNENWQLVEVGIDGDTDPLEQWVYDLRYIDSPIVRFFDGNRDGDLADTVDNTLYAINDANFNITGIVEQTTGDPVQRAIYTPYGQRTILTTNWQPATNNYSWLPGHQGLRHDAESGLVYNRARYLHTSMGVFTIRDLLGYVDGGSLYQYVISDPINNFDANGTNRTRHTMYDFAQSGHMDFAIDNWKCNQTTGAWQLDGYITYTFSVDWDAGAKMLLGIVYGPGRVTRVANMGRGNHGYSEQSTPCDDVDAIRRLDSLVANPPAYSSIFYNCRGFTMRHFDDGINNNRCCTDCREYYKGRAGELMARP